MQHNLFIRKALVGFQDTTSPDVVKSRQCGPQGADMQKREPVIIAPDHTDEELYEWMSRKLEAAQDLKRANESRTIQVESLSALEQNIAGLTKTAALNIDRTVKYPTHTNN